MEKNQLRVNGKRLQHTLEEMAKIGATPNGGVQRLALSDEDKQARDLFVKWLKELELEVSIDEMGNIFGKRKGQDETGEKKSEPFRFLSVFKWEKRKGWDVLLRAFFEEFSSTDNVDRAKSILISIRMKIKCAPMGY